MHSVLLYALWLSFAVSVASATCPSWPHLPIAPSSSEVLAIIQTLQGAGALLDTATAFMEMTCARGFIEGIEYCLRLSKGRSRESGDGSIQDVRLVSLMLTHGRCAPPAPLPSAAAARHALSAQAKPPRCRWGANEPFGHNPSFIRSGLLKLLPFLVRILAVGTAAELLHDTFLVDAAVDPGSEAEGVLLQVANRLYALRFFCRCMGWMPLGARLLGDCGGFLLGDLMCIRGRCARMSRACPRLPERGDAAPSGPAACHAVLPASPRDRRCHGPGQLGDAEGSSHGSQERQVLTRTMPLTLLALPCRPCHSGDQGCLLRVSDDGGEGGPRPLLDVGGAHQLRTHPRPLPDACWWPLHDPTRRFDRLRRAGAPAIHPIQ